MNELEKPLDIEEILAVLSHRYPFLLIDRVISFTNGEQPEITAIKNVTFNESFFQGHFPDHPVMPGVLIIEALAQASGVLAHLINTGLHNPGENYYLVKIDNARFNKTVTPGDQLELKVILAKFKRGMAFYDCVALVDGARVASANLLCAKGQGST